MDGHGTRTPNKDPRVLFGAGLWSFLPCPLTVLSEILLLLESSSELLSTLEVLSVGVGLLLAKLSSTPFCPPDLTSSKAQSVSLGKI